ncbi:hypothetical protein KM043_008958 [Ampulex compressa]|nr:hypothetical protein KM043_008958 [Ampulex compressa]
MRDKASIVASLHHGLAPSTVSTKSFRVVVNVDPQLAVHTAAPRDTEIVGLYETRITFFTSRLQLEHAPGFME